MTNVELLVIGGSAGSLEVLIALLPKLETGLRYAIVIVLHRKSTSDSRLTGLLATLC
ncbi:MAG: hypothetical protein EOP49_11835 [Sphingobacteriales bacterium]|nr:MAG: hypothetical protein EOP49_11835 [Sphingobacteriales bacterium]